MVHMARVVEAKTLVHGISVGVLQRRYRKVGLLPLAELPGRAKSADNARRFVRMLPAADHHGGIVAGFVAGRKDASGTGPCFESVSADFGQELPHLAFRNRLLSGVDRLLILVEETCGKRPRLDDNRNFAIALGDFRHDLSWSQTSITQWAA